MTPPNLSELAKMAQAIEDMSGALISSSEKAGKLNIQGVEGVCYKKPQCQQVGEAFDPFSCRLCDVPDKVVGGVRSHFDLSASDTSIPLLIEVASPGESIPSLNFTPPTNTNPTFPTNTNPTLVLSMGSEKVGK